MTVARQVARNTAAQALGKAAVLVAGRRVDRHHHALPRRRRLRQLRAGAGLRADARRARRRRGSSRVVVREISRAPGAHGRAGRQRARAAAAARRRRSSRSPASSRSPSPTRRGAGGDPHRRRALPARACDARRSSTVFQARLQMGRAAIADVAGRYAALAALAGRGGAPTSGSSPWWPALRSGAAVTLAVDRRAACRGARRSPGSRPLARAARGRRPARPRAGRQRDLLPRSTRSSCRCSGRSRRSAHYTLAYRVVRAARRLPRHRDDLGVPAALALRPPAAELAARVVDATADLFVAVAAPIAAGGPGARRRSSSRLRGRRRLRGAVDPAAPPAVRRRAWRGSAACSATR